MATIAQNLETIKNGIDDIKENLGLSSSASLSDIVTKAESVIEPTGTISITQNGTIDVTNYVNADVNVSGGSTDWSEYFATSVRGGNNAQQGLTNCVAKIFKKIPVTLVPTTASLGYAFYGCSNLEEAPTIDMSSITDLTYTFYICSKLETLPLYNTSNVASFYLCLAGTKIATFPAWDLSKGVNLNSMFSACASLENVPVMNWSSATNLSNIFNGCAKLTDTSLDNILQSCITATSYTGTKTLTTLGITSSNYSSAKIQSLPHYSDFTSAGWSIGY
jgi:hypothetical protein